MVGWKTLTLPKQLGGLGLRRLNFINDACLMKLRRAILKGESSLWSQVLVWKHGRGRDPYQSHVAYPTDSHLWKAIVKLLPIMQNNLN